MPEPISAVRPRGSLWRLLFLVAESVLAACLLLATIIVVAGFQDQTFYADLAVVFGNEVLPDGQPSPRLAARLDAALVAYRAGRCQTILVSGGIEPNGYDEAKVMAAYLSARGVATDRLLEDNAGVDTYHTARNTRRILAEHRWQSVCVVTQYYHVARARYAMHQFGIRPVASVHARYFEWRDLFSICRETVGFMKYVFRRYPTDNLPAVRPFFPSTVSPSPL